MNELSFVIATQPLYRKSMKARAAGQWGPSGSPECAALIITKRMASDRQRISAHPQMRIILVVDAQPSAATSPSQTGETAKPNVCMCVVAMHPFVVYRSDNSVLIMDLFRANYWLK